MAAVSIFYYGLIPGVGHFLSGIFSPFYFFFCLVSFCLFKLWRYLVKMDYRGGELGTGLPGLWLVFFEATISFPVLSFFFIYLCFYSFYLGDGRGRIMVRKRKWKRDVSHSGSKC